MKKVAIISPVNRVIIDQESIRSLEAVYLYKYLESKNYDVYYIGKKVKETTNKYIDIKDLNTLNDFDEIYIHNFNTNFFGGVVGAMTIQFLRLIKSYNNSIYYYITDPKLKYSNLAEDIYKRKNSKFEIPIERYELEHIGKSLNWHKLRFKALFTGYNYENIYGFETNNVEKFNVFHQIGSELNNQSNSLFDIDNSIDYDCCYYGDNRGSYRNNKIKKYFDTQAISTLLIGCDLPIQNNTFIKKVDHSKLQSLVKQCHSSIVIGDKEHENAFVTMRFYENIKFEVVSFIDIQYDTQKILFEDPLLKDFNYICSQEELIDKIKRIKTDQQFKETIINKQKQTIKSNGKEN